MNRRVFLFAFLSTSLALAEDDDKQKSKRPINPPGAPQPRPPEKPKQAERDGTRAER